MEEIKGQHVGVTTYTCVICGQDYKGKHSDDDCFSQIQANAKREMGAVTPRQTSHDTTVLDFGDIEITIRRK